MRYLPYNTPFEMQKIPEPIFSQNEVCSADFHSIQAAIDACATQGGGTVVVPSGEWKSGPIHLKSNINLFISKDAAIKFSSNPDDYLPVVFTRWEGFECYNYSPLIYANCCENIAVVGEGKLIGGGEDWWHWKDLQVVGSSELYDAVANNTPVKDRIYGTKTAALRPSFLQFINCKTALVEGVSFINGPQWTVHPVYCEDLIIRGVHINTTGHNTDGLNPDSCKNVLIEDSDFYTGDDCVAINSGINEDGWRVNRPCENIVIRNCTMTGGHGGVVIGSGLSGGVKNVYSHNCKISGTMQGIRLKSMRGRGGYIMNALFEDFVINDVSNEAIQINMFYEFSTVEPKGKTPSNFDGITIRNVSGSGAATAVAMRGLPEKKLKNITLQNISLAAQNAMLCSDIENLTLINMRLAF